MYSGYTCSASTDYCGEAFTALLCPVSCAPDPVSPTSAPTVEEVVETSDGGSNNASASGHAMWLIAAAAAVGAAIVCGGAASAYRRRAEAQQPGKASDVELVAAATAGEKAV